MAVSATVLALSAGGTVQAGACAHDSAPNIHLCTAALLQPTLDATPVDLTRVDGNEHPSSVLASAATAADDAWSMGPTAITVGHAMASLGGDAMAVDDVTVVDDGDLAFAAPAGFTFGPGDIELLTAIDNSSDIHVSGYGGNVVGYSAFDDIVTIDNSASIIAEAVPFSAGGYAAAIGVRAAGYDVEVHNEAGGLIGASAISDGGRARARAVYATGYFESVTVNNEGDIQSYARANGGMRAEAHGIYAFGYGSATTVHNAGDIQVSAQSEGGAGYATGITAIGYGSGDNDSVVVNNGSISAETDATYAYAFGIFNLTRQRYGDAYLTNDGSIHAEATGDLATATGVHNLALRYGDAATANAGTIEAVANGTYGGVATGINSYSNVYNVSVDNSGVVSATGTGEIAIATGIHVASSLYGATSVLNSGDITAHAYAGTGFAQAAGLVGESELVVDLTNYGDIEVIARSVDDTAFALGMYGSGVETTTLRNYGSVSVLAESTYGDAIAYGAFEYAGWAGIGVAINGGTIDVEASAGAGAQAHATGVNVIGDAASVFNDVSISATATAGDGGIADARGARAYGLYTAVSNYGDLTATASADGGVAMARGAESYGYFGSSVYNAGDLQASATAIGGEASAFGAYSLGIVFGAYTTNTGTISAQAKADSATAHGVLNASAYYGDAITTNTGSISAVAEGGVAAYGEYEAVAIGAYNFALLYNSVIDNSGSISATAVATADISGTDGFLVAKAVGAQSTGLYGYGDTVVANSGDIEAVALTSQGYASAWGAAVQSIGAYGGTALIDNDGAISAYAHTDIGMAVATGAYALNVVADSQVVNHGDIVGTARAERGITGVSVDFAVAYGAKVRSTYGNAAVSNYGNIESHAVLVGGIAYSYGVVASGMYASVSNAVGANIIATVETELFGGALVNGVTAGGLYGVNVVNDGSITAYGRASGYSNDIGGFYGASGATGIAASASFMGDTMVVNNGDVNAIAIAENAPSSLEGGAAAVGIDGYGDSVTIANAGRVTAIADAEYGSVGASGINAHGKYSNSITNAAGASIVAYASAGSMYGDSEAGRAFAWGTQTWASDFASTYNAGSIVAHAVVTPDAGATPGAIAGAYGSTVGRYSGILESTLVNFGDIEAAAQADFGYATAYGTYVRGQDESTTSNMGSIRASATAAEGNAWAVGSYGYSLHRDVSYNCDAYGCDWANPIFTIEGGQSLIDNAGDIVAAASAVGGVGYSYGAVTRAADVAGISNTGHISAITEADDALATGAIAISFYGDATLVNSGDIVASATGTTRAEATGALVRGANGAQLDNAGRILAGAYGADATATAVWMGDTGSNVLTNTGTIGAFGDGTRIAVSSGSGATASIVNSGELIGAVVTGDFGDSLENAAGGTWFAVGESDFGAGDNHIVNNGTIVMDDASIVLSGHADGAIAAFAAIQPASHISGSTFGNTGTLFVSGAYNTIDTGTFANNGIISFVDGAPDDVLTIVGDFAGSGVINLDVSGLNQTADRLYVDGSVIETTAQSVNVNLLDLPTAPNIDIPLITTSGTLAGDFVLGNVQFAQDGFVSMEFGLNVSADSVSLGVDVTGLNATGSLAAVLAPGVQSLVNAQVGTFRQRMGVVPEMGEAGLAPWIRLFSDSGDVDAGYSGNFGAGGLGFHQSNHGWEVGLDTRPSEHVAFGAFIAKSDGSQGLGGAGSNRLDGKTFGLYGTWFGGRGAYVDVSHRWTGVDARLRSAMGTHTTKASAQSFNVEGGFTAWASAGGLNVVPQLQYTRTRISDIRTLHASRAEFANDGGVSSRGRLGVAFDQSFQSGGFTLTPYGSLNVVREFDGDFDHAVNGGIQGTTGTEGTSAMVELGLGARKGKLSVSGGANWMDGGAVDSVTGAQLTVRYSW